MLVIVTDAKSAEVAIVVDEVTGSNAESNWHENCIIEQMHKLCAELGEKRKTSIYPLLSDDALDDWMVDDVYDRLRDGEYGRKPLDVIVHSSGGNIDAAYNLAQLFRRYCGDKLTFIVPRWAKSAATLLICAGDELLMTPVAELGPLDPQIIVANPFEKRMERFSPLDIDSTLKLIRDEYERGNADLASGLLQRLQFPLTLGGYKNSLKVGRRYVEKLLVPRMDGSTAKKISKKLTTGYANHSWCITVDEARELGLDANDLEGEELDLVWDIFKLYKREQDADDDKRKSKAAEDLRDFPELSEQKSSDKTSTQTDNAKLRNAKVPENIDGGNSEN